MKLIIVEGTDNTGKDTIISKILEYYPTSTIIHCSKPFSNKYSSKEQDELFNLYANNIINGLYDNTHIIIMNRSHIGEFVYGRLYRNRDPILTLNMINNIDEKLLSCKKLDIRYIQLLSSSLDLLHKNEDNKSLSKGDINKIKLEKQYFEEIFDFSKLNKKLIYVNNGDEFRNLKDIVNEVIKFIQ